LLKLNFHRNSVATLKVLEIIFSLSNIILRKFALKGNNYFIRLFDLFNSNAGFAKSFFP
jgi:hypothetical protein